MMVVVLSPDGRQRTRRTQAFELFHRQKLVTKTAMETLRKTILPGRSWLDVQRIHKRHNMQRVIHNLDILECHQWLNSITCIGGMTEAFELRIHVETLRKHFANSDTRNWSNDEVLAWLEESGFRLQGQTWWVEEISIELLDKSEYAIMRRL